MNSFIGWIGGKKALRQVIVDEFPNEVNKKYVEVFGGAGWVLFHKEEHKNQTEVYNDIDSKLVTLYRCLKYHQEELKKEFDFVIPSREMFNDFKEQVNFNGLTDIQRSVIYLYLIKASFGSKKDCFGSKPRSFDNMLRRFEEIHNRLKTVIIENKDFESLIKLHDSEETLFYLGPPYNGSENLYKNGHQFTKDDHIRLCELLKNIKGKFVLSYNNDEFIQGLYKDFNIKEVSRKNLLSSTSNTKEFKEVIIKNYK